jgi:cytochrome c553
MVEIRWFALAGILCACQASASGVGDVRVKAEELCSDCHGSNGKGDADNPNISGMAIDKFITAMKEYQSGARTKSKKMTKAANKVGDEEISDLAAYFGGLK